MRTLVPDQRRQMPNVVEPAVVADGELAVGVDAVPPDAEVLADADALAGGSGPGAGVPVSAVKCVIACARVSRFGWHGRWAFQAEGEARGQSDRTVDVGQPYRLRWPL
jgi:hypothetical protein